MGDLDLWVVVALVAAAFLAGLIDSIAGGGGLVTLPALLLAGLAPLDALDRETARRALDLPLDAPVIGFLARLSAQKNPLLMIEAFAKAHILELKSLKSTGLCRVWLARADG